MIFDFFPDSYLLMLIFEVILSFYLLNIKYVLCLVRFLTRASALHRTLAEAALSSQPPSNSLSHLHRLASFLFSAEACVCNEGRKKAESTQGGHIQAMVTLLDQYKSVMDHLRRLDGNENIMKKSIALM